MNRPSLPFSSFLINQSLQEGPDLLGLVSRLLLVVMKIRVYLARILGMELMALEAFSKYSLFHEVQYLPLGYSYILKSNEQFFFLTCIDLM